MRSQLHQMHQILTSLKKYVGSGEKKVEAGGKKLDSCKVQVRPFST